MSRNSLSLEVLGTSRWDPRLLHNHFDLFSLFFLFAANHPYRLSNNLRSDILRYVRTFRSNLLARAFLLCPIIPYRSGFAAVLPAWLRASWFALTCRFADPKTPCHKCTCGARPCLFFLSWFRCIADDSKPPDEGFVGVARVSGYALRCESTTAGHPVLHAL